MALRVNYDDVEKCTREISTTITVLAARKVDLQNIEKELSGSWKGIAANEFKHKLESYITELGTASSEMSSILKKISLVAENIKKEDKRLSDEIGGYHSGYGGKLNVTRITMASGKKGTFF